MKISICEVLCDINLLFCCFFRLTLMMSFFFCDRNFEFDFVFFPFSYYIWPYLSLSLRPLSRSTFTPQLPVPHHWQGAALGMNPGSLFPKVIGPPLHHHSDIMVDLMLTCCWTGHSPFRSQLTTSSWPDSLFRKYLLCIWLFLVIWSLSFLIAFPFLSLETDIWCVFDSLSQSTCILDFIAFCCKYYPWGLLSV